MKNIVILFLVASLSACSSAGLEVAGEAEGPKTVVFQNTSLASKMDVIDVKSAYVGDLLKVSASIRNKKGTDVSMQYQVTFLDADGMEIDIDSRPWTPVYVGAGGRKAVQAVAPNPRASAFRIYIKELKN